MTVPKRHNNSEASETAAFLAFLLLALSMAGNVALYAQRQDARDALALTNERLAQDGDLINGLIERHQGLELRQGVMTPCAR